MYELEVKESFSSAHYLRGYEGKCANTHGHNFQVNAVFLAEKTDALGLGCDFIVLKEKLREITDYLDHQDLNELPEFKKVNPTAELLAKYLYEKLKEKVGTLPVSVKQISVWETENCCATYWE